MLIRSFILGLLMSLPLASSALADKGAVYLRAADVKVSEDSQKAIILHNMQEEVLILGTEVRADRETPIISFIPFPSEPEVQLAPEGVFERLAAIVAKYDLGFYSRSFSKGGATATHEGVEVRLSARLGAHDLTVIKIDDAIGFTFWVNDYFRSKGLAHSESHPQEEAIVTDYVARGIDYFVLDYVEVPTEKHFIDPVIYRFKSKDLYYPLKTSNSFGGEGAIELFIIAPVTLCVPGSGNDRNPDWDFDVAVRQQGEEREPCLNFPANTAASNLLPSFGRHLFRLRLRASTSALLVPENKDLQGLYPDAKTFFDRQPGFIQAIRYIGVYDFKDDILVPVTGVPRELTRDLLDARGNWADPQNTWGLAGTNWRFIDVADRAVPASVSAVIGFEGRISERGEYLWELTSFLSGDSVSGRGGCNRFHGQFVTEYDSFGFSDLRCRREGGWN